MENRICDKCQAKLVPDSPGGMCPRCLMQLANDQRTMERNPGEALPPKPNQIAELFPELEILDVIGHGGMGYVYKARQKNLGRIVAVKILSTNLLDDPAFAERFSREARAMAMMNHPNIIAIYDFGCREKYYFLVMEYVDGLNLRQLVSTGEIKPEDAIQLVPQLCDALQYAHDRGVVHRDIKPENVLISQEGRIKIADFGLAKLTNLQQNLTLTQTRQVMGTPNYMAPEQREKPVAVDHRADIYSLGVVIYELLTGELPLGRFAPPSTKAKVDARIDELVMRALEKEPNLRYQKISELKTGFESLSDSPVAKGFAGNSARRHRNSNQPLAPGERSHASKVMAFVVMSFGILLGICGILAIILSGLVDDYPNLEVDEGITRVVGFSLLAAGGLIFAMYGIYSMVFYPDTKSKESEVEAAAVAAATTAEAKQVPKSSTALLLTSLGTISFFGCAAFFAIGSFIPGVTSWQGGIGCALLGACLMSIADLFEKSHDPSKRDILDDLLEPYPECPRCGSELKSKSAKQCFSCGYDWH